MIERLRSALGSDAVREPGTGIGVPGPAASAVVAPGDVDQAMAAMRICAENGWTVLPVGGATWMHAGFTGPADVLLSSERLRGIIEYEPADLAIAAHAGTTLPDLDAAARPHGQFFPVQPPCMTGATIGGAIATASAGPLRLGHGTPRDHVLGLQLVTGDGRRLDLGGRVVKNVAGYDLVRLIVGSRGSLGFVTRAFLRLRPRPGRDVTAVFRAPQPESLHQAAAGIMDTWPVAAELLAPATAARLLPGSGWVLALRWHGNASYADFVSRRIQDMAVVEPRVLDQAEAVTLWSRLALLEARQTAAFELAARPDLLPAALSAADTLSDQFITRSHNILDPDQDPVWHLAAHARSGIVRLWSGAAPDRDRLTTQLAEVRQQLGGSVTVRTLVFPPAAGEGEPGPSRGLDSGRVGSLMLGVRHVFDPWRVLAPDPTVDPAAVPSAMERA